MSVWAHVADGLLVGGSHAELVSPWTATGQHSVVFDRDVSGACFLVTGCDNGDYYTDGAGSGGFIVSPAPTDIDGTTVAVTMLDSNGQPVAADRPFFLHVVF